MGRNIVMKLRTLLAALTVSAGLMLGSVANAKSSCKELSKSSCGTTQSCSWTKGYKTKKGVKVNSYCRSKPGKKTNKVIKKPKKKISASKSKKKASSKKTNK
jgi:hypothetical protein